MYKGTDMRLKEIRESRGLTQDQIAKELCVTRQAISRWENGKTQPDIQSLTKLSEIYNCSIDELVKDSEAYFLDEKFETTDDFNKFLIWIPIIGILYLVYYVIRYKNTIRGNIKKIVVARISITVFIAVAFTFSYISFMNLLS